MPRWGDKAERKDNGLSSNHFHSNREGNEYRYSVNGMPSPSKDRG
jgi:hypothetical protein